MDEPTEQPKHTSGKKQRVTLKWHQYVAIVLGIVAIWFIVVGAIWENGLLLFVGIAMIVGGVIPLYRSKDKSKTKSNGG